jgi:hypothetical protein
MNLSYGIPGNCNDEGGCGKALCFSCYPDASINQKTQMKEITVSLLISTAIVFAAAPAMAVDSSKPYGGNPCPVVGHGYPNCQAPVPPTYRPKRKALHVPPYPPNCRNVNDDVKECRDKRQGPPHPKGYVIAFKTMPPTLGEPTKGGRSVKL